MLQSKKLFQKFLTSLSLLVIVFLVLLSLIFGSAVLWYQANIKPTTAEKEKVIIINKGDSFLQVAQKLEEEGIIRNSVAFRIYLRLNNKEPAVQAGSFKIKTGLKPEEVLQALAVGRVDKWITLREGLRVEEMAEKLSKEFPVKEEDFLKASREGYMFPDTYLIPVEADGKTVASILRKNFDKRTAELKSSIGQSTRSLAETVVLASLVERESRSSAERPIIAGILLKRLKIGMRLEVDATIQYALGYQQGEQTWWKKNLDREDLAIVSSYNTRKNAGLPPAPICNPGLSSIKAVISPQETDYYYYLHDKEGKVHFAKTLDEHNANVAKYL
ncbi:MAG: endolytic transglycosylase MltG [bacterium]|nr:endolytic transglycosylase MltG [bacterium]